MKHLLSDFNHKTLWQVVMVVAIISAYIWSIQHNPTPVNYHVQVGR
jgi:hypothetical protein